MRTMSIGNWKFNVDGNNRLRLSDRNLAEIERLLPAWEAEFQWENTWVRKETGKPTLILRVDLSLQWDGSVGIYEFEERPAGLGLSATLNEIFRSSLSDLAKKWQRCYGPITVVVSNRRSSADDSALEKMMGIRTIKGPPSHKNFDENLFLVRAEPEETEYWNLATRSISSVKSKGDKSYGLALNLWSPIPQDTDLLPWDAGFVLKPRQGSKTHGISLWHPSEGTGISRRTKLEKEIRSGRVGYVQNWIDPETHRFLPKGYFLIRRVYWGWDPEENRWVYLGGMWNARPNFVVHGAPDAIFGCAD